MFRGVYAVTVLNTQFSILFPKIINIKRNIMEREETLLKEFMPCQIFPIPDDAPMELPRVSVFTKNNHSNLSISMSGCTLNTQYDDNFNRDWPKCEHYLKGKSSLIYDVIEGLSPDSIYFQGFVAQILWDKTEGDPMYFLKDKITKLDIKGHFHDLSCKFTLIKDDKYFVNLSLIGIKAADPAIMGIAPVPDAMCQNKLLINIDINDRRRFNEEPGYNSTKETTRELLSVLSTVIRDKLGLLLTEGGIEL